MKKRKEEKKDLRRKIEMSVDRKKLRKEGRKKKERKGERKKDVDKERKNLTRLREREKQKKVFDGKQQKIERGSNRNQNNEKNIGLIENRKSQIRGIALKERERREERRKEKRPKKGLYDRKSNIEIRVKIEKFSKKF